MTERICCLCERPIGNGSPYLSSRAALGKQTHRHVECDEADTAARDYRRGGLVGPQRGGLAVVRHAAGAHALLVRATAGEPVSFGFTAAKLRATEAERDDARADATAHLAEVVRLRAVLAAIVAGHGWPRVLAEDALRATGGGT